MTQEKQKPVTVSTWLDGFTEPNPELETTSNVNTALENAKYDDYLKEAIRSRLAEHVNLD